MDPVKQVLLRRSALFFAPASLGDTPAPSHYVDAVEARLAGLGYVMTGRLRAALQGLSKQRLEQAGTLLLTSLAEALGANQNHEPLFRRFPRGVPKDSFELYVRRVLVHLLQEPEQPCLLCDAPSEIHALKPCGHLVCGRCFDGSNYSACPICNRKIDPDTPFLKPTAASSEDPALLRTARFRRLDLGTGVQEAARAHFVSFLERTTPLSPQDTEDLTTILDNVYAHASAWLPARIPVREIMALTIGRLLSKPLEFAVHADLVSRYVKTATDVLRVLCVYAGGAPDLIEKPERFRSMPRRLRTLLLGVLEACSFETLAEDLRRHVGLWKRAAEPLHPFERYERFPKTALAFAVLRRTRVDADTDLSAALRRTAEAQEGHVVVSGKRLVFRSWSSRLETALVAGDWGRALDLVRQRPGELSRRLDHLLRTAQRLGEPQVEALRAEFASRVERMAPAILLTLAPHLRARAAKAAKRVFFPRGEVMLSWATGDERDLLPHAITAPFADAVDTELLRRAGRLPPYEVAFLDAALARLSVPFNERTASRALVAVPRGSVLPLPEGVNTRLFLHWMEPRGQRVDLDLSVSFYDAAWDHVTQCDYTSLRLANGMAVHSGDFTNAPGPQGASEFVDLDLDALRDAGVRYAVMVVFSYNDVPFDALPRGFAGFMSSDGALPEVFDAPSVAQRFDLQGRSKITAPMLVDLEERSMLWMDVNLSARDGHHNVDRHQQGIGHVASDFVAYFQGGSRPTLWHLSCLHAAARTGRVLVRDEQGAVRTFRRGPAEAPLAFYRRLVAREGPHEVDPEPSAGDEPWFVSVLDGDRAFPYASTVYALRGDGLDASSIERVAASDLVAALAVE